MQIITAFLFRRLTITLEEAAAQMNMKSLLLLLLAIEHIDDSLERVSLLND